MLSGTSRESVRDGDHCSSAARQVVVLVAAPLVAVAEELLPAVLVGTLVLLVGLVALVCVSVLVRIGIVRVCVVGVVGRVVDLVGIAFVNRLAAHIAAIILATGDAA